MSWIDYIKDKLTNNKPNNANLAKERLQVIVSHERNTRKGPDFLPEMQKEILAVIAKYVDVDLEKVHVNCDNQGGASKLELNLVLPNNRKTKPEQSNNNTNRNNKHHKKHKRKEKVT